MVWYKDTYYMFPERINHNGLNFEFSHIKDDKPYYVYEGESLKIQAEHPLNEFILYKDTMYVWHTEDLITAIKLDKFFAKHPIISSSKYHTKIKYGKSVVDIVKNNDFWRAILPTERGLAEITFTPDQIDDVFKNPEKYVSETIIDVPKDRIRKTETLNNGIRVFFANGVYVTIRFDGAIIFFSEIGKDDAKKLAEADDIVTLLGLMEPAKIDIKSSYDGNPVDIARKLIDYSAKKKGINGPLVRVDRNQIETPRGFITLKSTNPKTDQTVRKAVAYVLGMNDEFTGYIGVVLDEKRSTVHIKSKEKFYWTYKLDKILVWEVHDGLYTNGKHYFQNSLSVSKNNIPANVPIKKTALQKIKNREDVYPSDVLPGLPKDSVITPGRPYVTIKIKKKRMNTIIRFHHDGVEYNGVPYLEGNAVIKVPWSYEKDIMSQNNAPEEFLKGYRTKTIENYLDNYEEIETSAGGIEIIRYKWGHIFITKRYIEIQYNGVKRRFADEEIVLPDEKSIKLLIHLA